MDARPVRKLLILGELPRDYLREWNITEDLKRAQQRLGVELEEVPVEHVIGALDALEEPDHRTAGERAQEVAQGAQRSEAVPERLRRAAEFYMAMRRLLRERGADGVTVNCAAWKCDRRRPLPCVGLMLLQEQGVPAVCQGDMDAFLTAALFHRAGAWPTYIGGPHPAGDGVVDVSHCVLPRTMADPDGPPEPYYVADYHGNGWGCTVHTRVPEGTPVTVARLTRGLDALLLGAGTVAGNADRDDRCRNTVYVRMDGAAALLKALRGHQQHLVVACGDCRTAVAAQARERGIDVRPV
jgi:L-fucose isomerase-like protein